MKRVLTAAAPRVAFTENVPALRAITLRFGSEVPLSVRARVTYAVQVFASIYCYRFLDRPSNDPHIALTYGIPVEENADCSVHIPARYRVGRLRQRESGRVRARYGDEEIFLHHGVDAVSGRPDWLGEIFEWLTGSYELEAAERDSVGRIPYSASVFARENLSPRKPYASILMAWLQSEIAKHEHSTTATAPPVSPDADHLVVSSHDIDFHWVRAASASLRLAKNLAIASTAYKSRQHLRDTASMLRSVAAGRRVGDFIPSLLHAAEKWNFRSTLFVVARHGHRRDPDYRLSEIRQRLVEARDAGFDVELHGSYSSVVESNSLATEADALAAVMDRPTHGGRQHWLRFDSHEKLFASINSAGLVYDSTLGFPETVGFRNGAGFAFPPYDFENEKPHEFLEFPLVLMDGGLEAEARRTGENPQAIAEEVLSQSRRWGWGGVSALWHNPIEPLSVPSAINDVFWQCLAQQDRHREKWISAGDFLARSLSRYQNAGLLKGVRADA